VGWWCTVLPKLAQRSQSFSTEHLILFIYFDLLVLLLFLFLLLLLLRHGLRNENGLENTYKYKVDSQADLEASVCI